MCDISLSLVGHYPREEPTIITHFNSKSSGSSDKSADSMKLDILFVIIL